MPSSQRGIGIAIVRLAIVLAMTPALYLMAQAPAPPMPPQPVPSPNAPNPNFPPGLNGQDIKIPDSKTLDKQNQIELRNDIDRLYALAFVLREQMKTTDTSATLSLTVVKRAREIEKLAKEIRDRAKH